MGRKQRFEDVAKRLSPEKLQIISKDNPFLKERNALIRRLVRLGATRMVLAEVTGLSIHQICKIAQKRTSPLIEELAGIRRALEGLVEIIPDDLQTTTRRGSHELHSEQQERETVCREAPGEEIRAEEGAGEDSKEQVSIAAGVVGQEPAV